MGFETQTSTGQALFNEQLKSRGYTEKDAVRLGLSFMPTEETRKQFGWEVGPCLRIMYFDEDGEAIPDYYRCRRLVNAKPKYVCEKGSMTQIYFAPEQPVSTRVAQHNTDIQLIITEGEFKALAISAALKAEGLDDFFVIGLQGVDQFGATDRSRIHPVLARFKTNSRDVYIVYDFDGTTPTGDPKIEVQNAEARLASILALMGCHVKIGRIGRLATHKEFKYAIDDYLGEKKLLVDFIKNPGMFTEDVAITSGSRLQALYEYRAQFALIGGFFVNMRTYEQLPRSRQDVQYGHLAFTEMVQKGQQMVPTLRSTTEVYTKWQKALRLHGIGFDARRQGELITGDGKLNTFKKWGNEPVDGDISPYLELLATVCRNTVYENYLLDWAAQIAQRPWEKNHTVPMIVGREEGTGKSLVVDTLAKALGVGDGMPAHIGGPEELFGAFNGHLIGKVLFIANEVGTDSKRDVDKLKQTVTGPHMLFNQKYGAQIVTDNYLNIGITSNNMNPMKIDGSGRREALIDAKGTKASNLMVCQRLVRFIDYEYGLNKILGFLLARDISKFNPRLPAPMTGAKEAAVDASKSAREHVADEIMDKMMHIYGGMEFMAMTPDQLRLIVSDEQLRRLNGLQPLNALSLSGYGATAGTEEGVTMRAVLLRLPNKTAGIGGVVRVNVFSIAGVVSDYDKMAEHRRNRQIRGWFQEFVLQCFAKYEVYMGKQTF